VRAAIMFALAPKLNRAGARQFSTLLDASLDMLRSAWELRHRWQVTTVSQGPPETLRVFLFALRQKNPPISRPRRKTQKEVRGDDRHHRW